MDGAVTPGPEADKTVTRVKVLEEQLKSARLGKLLRWISFIVLIITLVATIIAIMQYQRLADCGARIITVTEKRNSYTAELRAQTDKDQENLRSLVEKVTSPQAQSPGFVRQALEDYQTEADAIQAEREKIRSQQDKYKYPSLDDCD